jgi:polysaccharide export outer membrane protein
LKDALTTQFKEYVNNPVVTVIVQDAVSAQISIIGEVRSPGPQVMNGSLTVLQALAKAGGLGEFANKSKIRILRHNGSRTEPIDYDYKRTLNGETEDVYLQPGDTIVVP